MNDLKHWLEEVALDLSFNFDIAAQKRWTCVTLALDMPLEHAISYAVHLSPAHFWR